MICLLKEKATASQIHEMLERYEDMIKIVVDTQRIEFESLINIRPRLGNRSILIQDEDIRRQVEEITRDIFGDVK